MVWNDFHFYSETLGIQTAAYVLMPEADVLAENAGKPLPTLYLLHGLSDDHTMWLRNTRIAQYARHYYMAVVMPAGNRSFYMDMAHGAKYGTFVGEELPRVMESYLPLSRARAGRYAAGLSMGGYGAMKLGLSLPHRYAAVAALSAPLWMQTALDDSSFDPAMAREFADIYGGREGLITGEGNLARLADELANADAPKIYMGCGTDDFLYSANEAFYAHFGQKFGIDYVREPGASHTWDYWDAAIRDVLRWLPLQRLENVF